MHNNVQCQTKDWVPGRRHSQQRKVFVLRFIGQKISLSWFYQLCSGNDQGRWRQAGRQELWLHILGVRREIKFTTFLQGEVLVVTTCWDFPNSLLMVLRYQSKQSLVLSLVTEVTLLSCPGGKVGCLGDTYTSGER